MPAWIWENQIDEFSKKYHVFAVDPRSQGESDKPNYGHLPETRARDYMELVDHLGLKQPVLVGWSMACGELMKYVEQLGTENVGGLVLVDGILSEKPIPEMFATWSVRMSQLQQDRQKQADGFVRRMYKKLQTEDYIKRVVDASIQVPADTAAVLIYNMIAPKDFSVAVTVESLQSNLVAELRIQKVGALLQVHKEHRSIHLGMHCSSMTRRNSIGCSKNSCRACPNDSRRDRAEIV
jgi:pimeloyl-ACP methyl ester carboxylesterase